MSSPSSTSTPPSTARAIPIDMPEGFGVTVCTQGDKELWRMSICLECGATVADQDEVRQQHRDWHAKINKALAAFLIEEF
jgi:hypothetical protein